MHFFETLFGIGKDLNTLQMCCRGIAIFFIALLLIRISGRRSFGLHTPLDNIIAILLGAVLSRAVVGASPFLPVTLTCFCIVLLHRFTAWLMLRHPIFYKLVEGDKRLIYAEGKFIRRNMNRFQIGEEDVLQEVCRTALTEDMSQIDKVYVERNGEISAIRKQSK